MLLMALCFRILCCYHYLISGIQGLCSLPGSGTLVGVCSSCISILFCFSPLFRHRLLSRFRIRRILLCGSFCVQPCCEKLSFQGTRGPWCGLGGCKQAFRCLPSFFEEVSHGVCVCVYRVCELSDQAFASFINSHEGPNPWEDVSHKRK